MHIERLLVKKQSPPTKCYDPNAGLRLAPRCISHAFNVVTQADRDSQTVVGVARFFHSVPYHDERRDLQHLRPIDSLTSLSNDLREVHLYETDCILVH
jgi:hypothetical protein